MIAINDSFLPLLEAQERFLVMLGGSGSGKSRFACQKKLIRIKTEPGHKILCIRKVRADLKDSVIAELKATMHQMKIFHEFEERVADKMFVHLPTGNQIICRGLDDPEKIKSISGITSMWIEEATELTEEEFNQLNIRIRGVHHTYVQYILTFNGIRDNHWIRNRFFKEKHPNTKTHESTYQDNYFLDEEYRQVLESYKDLDPYFYEVYTKGGWGTPNKSLKFLYNWDHSKHTGGVSLDDKLSIRLSFDFNIDPFAVSIYQRIDQRTLHIVDKIKESSDIEQVCDKIISNYGQQEFIVTGDASGKARSGVVRGKRSYWQTIKVALRLRDQNMRIRDKNLDLIESRVICNAVLKRCNVVIDKDYTELINDCNYANVDERGILIKDRNNNKNDFLDTFRYLCDSEFHDIVKHPMKYA